MFIDICKYIYIYIIWFWTRWHTYFIIEYDSDIFRLYSQICVSRKGISNGLTWHGARMIFQWLCLFGFRESRWPNMLVKYKKIQPGKDRKLPVKLMFGMKGTLWCVSGYIPVGLCPTSTRTWILGCVWKKQNIYIRTYLYVYPHVCIFSCGIWSPLPYMTAFLFTHHLRLTSQVFLFYWMVSYISIITIFAAWSLCSYYFCDSK